MLRHAPTGVNWIKMNVLRNISICGLDWEALCTAKSKKGFSLIVWYFQCSELVDAHADDTVVTVSLWAFTSIFFLFSYISNGMSLCCYFFFYVGTYLFLFYTDDTVLSFSVMRHVCQCGVWKKRTTGALCKWIFKCDWWNGMRTWISCTFLSVPLYL